MIANHDMVWLIAVVFVAHPIWVLYIPPSATHTDQVYMWHLKVLTEHPFKARCLITPWLRCIVTPYF